MATDSGSRGPADNPHANRPIHGPVTLAELTAGLIWPTLFRAVPLALQPARMALGFLVIAVVMGVGTIFDAIAGPIVPSFTRAASSFARTGKPRGLFASLVDSGVGSFHAVVESLLSFNPRAAWFAASDFFASDIPRITSAHTGAVLVLGLVFVAIVLPVRTLVSGAIARMAASEVALRRNVSVAEGLRFSAARWKSLFAAVIAPPIIIAVICLLLMVGGFVLFRLPVLNVVGGLLYGLFLFAGLLVVFLGVGFAFASHMLAPAVAADGADAVDALQRAYAYTIGRPGRLLIYALVLVLVGFLTYAAIAHAVAFAMNLTASLAGVWSNADELAGRIRALSTGLPSRPLGLSGTAAATDALIGVWERLLLALLGAFVVSYHDCASTLLYLLLRRVNDEQDIEDILPDPAPPPPAAS